MTKSRERGMGERTSVQALERAIHVGKKGKKKQSMHRRHTAQCRGTKIMVTPCGFDAAHGET